MALFSMTGFGSKSATVVLSKLGKLVFFVEIKSINSRFFETQCKLPPALSNLEIKIMNLLQKKLIRGRIYLNLRFANENEAFEEIMPSLKTAEQYLNAQARLKQTFKLDSSLSLDTLLQLPNVLISAQEQLTEQDEEAILGEISSAGDNLLRAREQEGATLLIDLKKRFAICKEKMALANKYSQDLMIRLKQEIDKNLPLVEQGDELAKVRLEELYMTVNKADVHEEITRFNSHLKSVDELFKSPTIEKGKHLDFILQELLRETNTTMAKCNDFNISSCCIDIKIELEKAREQTQNLV